MEIGWHTYWNKFHPVLVEFFPLGLWLLIHFLLSPTKKFYRLGQFSQKYISVLQSNANLFEVYEIGMPFHKYWNIFHPLSVKFFPFILEYIFIFLLFFNLKISIYWDSSLKNTFLFSYPGLFFFCLMEWRHIYIPIEMYSIQYWCSSSPRDCGVLFFFCYFPSQNFHVLGQFSEKYISVLLSKDVIALGYDIEMGLHIY